MSNANNVIKIRPRSEFGNNASRRLRGSGSIPAIIYGKGVEPRPVMVDVDEWKVFHAHHSGHAVVTLCEEGQADTAALVREIQYNYLKNYVVHIDFQAVDLTAEIASTVAIHAFGDCYGAAHGGILEQELHELPVIARPADLPEAIKADVSKLDIGDVLTVANLVLPAGVRTELDGETVLFHVVRPREEEAAPAAEEGTSAEPEAINEKKAEARAVDKESK